jgi:hypothetical protein
VAASRGRVVEVHRRTGGGGAYRLDKTLPMVCVADVAVVCEGCVCVWEGCVSV